MSEIANYTFIPWMRQGLANHISSHSGVRATVKVELTVTGEKLGGGQEEKPKFEKNIEIYGPGDIIGIEQSAIFNVEPKNWISNFEPNYLPFIEFYDEDFPWRYSPETPDKTLHRLKPWIMLVVLREDEFKDGKNISDRPLAYITPEATAVLPPSDQLWAWAHIHVNKNIIGSDITTPGQADGVNDPADVESTFDSLLKSDPDKAYSRIFCPRKLEPNVGYHAFLVPAYETGLKSGLGQDPTTAAAYNSPAWAGTTPPQELPYYYRWYFRTGNVGDFEYLVRLLEPKPVDSRVGLRSMDMQTPGANIDGIIDEAGTAEEDKLHGVLKLGGALKIPDRFYSEEELDVVNKYRDWATNYPHSFQSDLASFINLTDSYSEKSAEDANADSNINEVDTVDPTDPDANKQYDIAHNKDPLITAPLYGRWHALTQRLLKERDNQTDVDPNDNWVHNLNLDPRWRVASGFGTGVVQDNQEDYMKAAWNQVGDILASNKKIREAQVAKEVSWVWYESHLKPIKEKFTGKWLTISAPVQARVLNQGITVAHQIKQSKVPQVVFSNQMRKMTRPRGRLATRLQIDKTPKSLDKVVVSLNNGVLSAAPPRELPNMPTVNDVVDAAKPNNAPNFLLDWLEKHTWLRWLPLVIALILVLVLILFSPAGSIATLLNSLTVAMVALYAWFRNMSKKLDVANSLLEENQTPEAVDEMPPSLDFRISTPEENFIPTVGVGQDSPEAERFKIGLKNSSLMIQESIKLGAKPIKPALNLNAVNTAVFTALNPQVTIPNWVWGSVFIPGRIKDELEEDFIEAMAYPEIDLPMYKPLADKSSELFLPNINYISENSISLLETHQEFIESYMMGLNHEFARELLWREYPTDQRGSYFRQFWDSSGYHDTEDLREEELKEKLRDIPPIHTWLKKSKLGDHDHREEKGENNEEVVLVIRGELLKKYPNAIIYAHKAAWRKKDTEDDIVEDPIANSDQIDLTRERDLMRLKPHQEQNPPREIVKTPLYEAKVDPDIYFFGFDLTVCEAFGGTGNEDEPIDELCQDEGIHWAAPGWFFVIKERSGEIRLGLDVGDEEVGTGDIKVWNDLSWDHVTPKVNDGEFLQIMNQTQLIDLETNALDPDEDEKITQREEDVKITWNQNMSSADLAYVLYQVPVLVAVHATEMMPKD